MTYETIVTTNTANWREVLEANKLVVVMFWHQQCPYCRILEPISAELSRVHSNRLKFAIFNFLENQENELLAAR